MGTRSPYPYTWRQNLTLSQTTNSRLFQTERLCRQQFKIWWKWQKVLLKGRKHCGKRRNCSLRAMSPFPTVFLKDLYCRHVKTRASFGKIKTCSKLKALAEENFNVAQMVQFFSDREENIVGKEYNAQGNGIFSFSLNVFYPSKSQFQLFIHILQMFSIWASPKFCSLVKTWLVNGSGLWLWQSLLKVQLQTPLCQ